MRMTFEQWKREVDNALERRLGLISDDLPDWDYWTHYNEGFDPKEAVEFLLEEMSEELGWDMEGVE